MATFERRSRSCPDLVLLYEPEIKVLLSADEFNRTHSTLSLTHLSECNDDESSSHASDCGDLRQESIDGTSSTGTAEPPQDRIPEDLDCSSFRRLGCTLLLVQGLSTVVLTLYAWAVENPLLGSPFFYIFQIWCMGTTWKVSIPYAENSFLCRISAFISLHSWNELILEAQNDTESLTYTDIVVRVIAPRLFLIMILICTLERSANCLRQQYTSNDSTGGGQSHLNAISSASLIASLKAFLVIVYLLASVLVQAGTTTFEEVEDQLEFLRDREAKRTEADVYITYTENEASEIDEGVDLLYQACMAGISLNLYLILSLIMMQMACLSFSEVVNMRVTFYELVVATASSIHAILTIIFLAMFSSDSLGEAADDKAQIVFMWMLNLAGLASVLFSGFLATSISRGKHPYILERLRRRSSKKDGPGRTSVLEHEDLLPMIGETA